MGNTPRTSPARSEAEARAAAAAPPAQPGADAPPQENEGGESATPPAAAAPPVARTKATRDALTSKLLPKRVWDLLQIASEQAGQLLAEACYVFGINPDPQLKPRELASYRFSEGEPDGTPPVPAHVVIVTAGGTKIQYPIDNDTEHRLRVIYNAFVIDKATGEKKVLPLPPDLTLPRQYVDGMVRSSEHQYRTGYLKEGGADEAARRSKLAQLRSEGKLR